MIGIAVALVVAGTVAVARSPLLDDDGEDLLDVDLASGGSHDVSAVAPDAVSIVEADYELKNTGSTDASVTLTLTAPDGTVLDSQSATVAPGKHLEIEVGHDFGSAVGAVGTYSAHLTVQSGSVHVTEGGVDINEQEDGEDGGDDE